MGIWNRIILQFLLVPAAASWPFAVLARGQISTAPSITRADYIRLDSILSSGKTAKLKAALMRLGTKTPIAASLLLRHAIEIIPKKQKSPLTTVKMLIDLGATADKIPIGPNEFLKPVTDRFDKKTEYWRWSILNSAIYNYVPGLLFLLRKACNFN